MSFFSQVTLRLSTFILLLIICSVEPGYSSDKYKKGHYFKGTEKVEGYIYFGFNTYESFFFKKELSAKREKITIKESNGFAFEDKNFIRLSSITIKAGTLYRAVPQAFAEHVIEGPINLYKVYSMNAGNSRGGTALYQGGPKVVHVFLEKNKSGSYILAEKGDSHFQHGLRGLFTERADVVEKISNGYYSIGNVEAMVSDYNAPK